MQSFDVILKETSQCYQVVKLKKNDIQKRMKENQEKNNFTVKKFEESIEIVNENFNNFINFY